MAMSNNGENIRLERQGRVATLTLNRPAQRNSLSIAMLKALDGALEELSSATDTKVIVLAAEGTAFSAGHDLKELTAARAHVDRGRAFYAETMQCCSAVMQKLVHCPKPVIAAVQGIATAAGCQLVASCDLAIAVESAKFATPGVDIGLFCSTPMVALTRNLSRKQSMEMLLTGAFIDAKQACDWGLVNRVVSPSALADEVYSLAAQIASKSSRTVKIGKEAFYRQLEMGLSDAYDYASHVMVENLLNADAEEGIDAFLEKRQPRWLPPS